MSATQSWLGPLAWNWRLTRSLAGAWRLSRRVVTVKPRRRLMHRMLAKRMRRATRWRLMHTPCSMSSALTRGMP
jgi:hypothetical protein